MSRAQTWLFSGEGRMTMHRGIDLTLESLRAWGPQHDHWCVAWSGGKDSTALLTFLVWALDAGKVDPPRGGLTVFFADTRLELLPLMASAAEIREDLVERGIDVRTVMAPMDKRFMVYVLGRGVPPPNNNTLRWCTRQIKIDPMADALKELHGDLGSRLLMLTGVRQGESAIRDGRIAMSCSKDGAECGQGWYQRDLEGERAATLAPLLHWRVCHVWEWLKHWAPSPEFGDWSTQALADAYGGDEAEELNARTGCMGCPLATKDTALDSALATPRWSYLRPLKQLRPLWRELRKPERRLRQPGGERRKDGTLAKNQQRLGPLTLETRLWALDQVLAIQAEVNVEARRRRAPELDLLNAEEEARIRELIDAGTWPDGWSGDEPTGDVELDTYYADGSVQPLLLRIGAGS